MTAEVVESGFAVGRPHPALAGLVGGYHGYRIVDSAPGVHRGLPSRALTLVLSFDEPLDVGWLDRDGTRDRYWVVASGLSSGPAAITHQGRQFGVQVDVTPAGARALFGMPAAAIADDLVSLQDLVGRDEHRIYDAVASGGDWQQRFAALDHELLRLRAARSAATGSVRPELTEAWRWLGRHVGSGTVGALAAEVGWSGRHLTEQFRAEYGLGPKQVARIVRFDRARFMLARPAPPPLAAVAADCGYADQAHLTREWREFSGCTPTQWRRDEFAFLQELDTSG